MHAFAELGRESVEDLTPRSGNRDTRALSMKGARDGASNRAGRPRHQRCFPGEFEHWFSSAACAAL
jgi:hypothetical protein